jgi:hypothetical protein
MNKEIEDQIIKEAEQLFPMGKIDPIQELRREAYLSGAKSLETRYKQLLETFAELIAAYDTPGPVRDQAVKKAKWILAYEDENSKDSLASPQNSNP